MSWLFKQLIKADAWLIFLLSKWVFVPIRDKIGQTNWQVSYQCFMGFLVTSLAYHGWQVAHGSWLNGIFIIVNPLWIGLYEMPKTLRLSRSESGVGHAIMDDMIIRVWLSVVFLSSLISVPFVWNDIDLPAVISLAMSCLLWLAFYSRSAIMPPPKTKEEWKPAYQGMGG